MSNRKWDRVVGTSYQLQIPASYIRSEATLNEEVYKVTGILVPEPENQFDENAIKVMIPLHDNTAHKLGYVAKVSPLYDKIKAPTQVDIYMYAPTLTIPAVAYKIDLGGFDNEI